MTPVKGLRDFHWNESNGGDAPEAGSEDIVVNGLPLRCETDICMGYLPRLVYICLGSTKHERSSEDMLFRVPRVWGASSIDPTFRVEMALLWPPASKHSLIQLAKFSEKKQGPAQTRRFSGSPPKVFDILGLT